LTGNSDYGFGRSYPMSLIGFGILSTIFLSMDVSKNRIIKTIKTLFLFVVIFLIVMLPAIKYGSDPYHFFSESEDKANQFGYRYIEQYELFDQSFSNMIYNSRTLKEQTGEYYLNQFNNIMMNKIYDVGKTNQIYYYSEKTAFIEITGGQEDF